MVHYEDQIDMLQLLKEIAPLKRTIACDDTDKALQIISEYLSGSIIEGYQCGSRVWSWIIPKRWELDGAIIKANGKTLVDASWNPLHVMNYSQPYKGVVSRDELFAHIYTNPDRPDAIPFKYTYYKKDWGFCVPHSWLNRFVDEMYDVEIDSRFEDGNLNTLSFFMKGENEETIILWTEPRTLHRSG